MKYREPQYTDLVFSLESACDLNMFQRDIRQKEKGKVSVKTSVTSILSYSEIF